MTDPEEQRKQFYPPLAAMVGLRGGKWWPCLPSINLCPPNCPHQSFEETTFIFYLLIYIFFCNMKTRKPNFLNRLRRPVSIYMVVVILDFNVATQFSI